MAGLDATALILQAHGEALRLIADSTGQHFQGLAQASRTLRKQGLPSNVARKLQHLDAAASLARHITSVSLRNFLADLQGGIASRDTVTVGAAHAAPHEPHPEQPFITEQFAKRAKVHNTIAHKEDEKLPSQERQSQHADTATHQQGQAEQVTATAAQVQEPLVKVPRLCRSSAPQDTIFQPGDFVELFGLTSLIGVTWNGCRGQVVAAADETGRVGVQVNGQTKDIRRVNLRCPSPSRQLTRDGSQDEAGT